MFRVLGHIREWSDGGDDVDNPPTPIRPWQMTEEDSASFYGS